ncbi:response regulator [Turneriella parva]|nr:response regulator [Turneriella parva]
MFHNAPFSGMKLMVVDDEYSIRSLVMRMAEVWGYIVQDCSSAESALIHLERDRFNIILTDIHMAKMDGVAFAEQVRKKMPSIAIAMMTGYASPKTAKKSQDLGAIYYLKKPFTNEELSQTLKIAAHWNISMLLDRAARKYLKLKQGHERDTQARITSIKSEIKSQLRSPGTAVALREFVYATNVEKNQLYAHLNGKFSIDSVKSF